MGTISAALIVIVCLFIYFLPSIIGYRHRNANSITLLNFFLGWTLIGWVVALVWAVSNDKKQPIIIENKTIESKTSTDQLLKLKELLDGGYINENEFSIEKEKILNK